MKVELHRRRPNRVTGPRVQGTVLIIVMWIALGLVALTLLFGHSMYFEYKGADNALAGRQAEQAIEGALRYVLFLLQNQEEEGVLPDPSTYRAQQVTVGEAQFWLLGRDEASSNPTAPAYGIMDEASKLNLNTATLEMLEALPGMPPELAAAIIDWRDPDEEVTPNGAESQSYTLQDSPYPAKNAPFETVEELRLLQGATSAVLYGEDTNLNGILDPNENDGDLSPPTDNQDGVLEKGILEYVTVYTQPRQQAATAPEGAGQGPSDNNRPPGSEASDARININTASAAVLAAVPGIDAAEADQIVAYRQTNELDPGSTDWINQVLDEDSAREASPFLTGTSHQFMADIVAVGRHGRGYRRVRYVIDTSQETPIVLYRKDLSRSGWALGQAVRQALQSTQATHG